MNRIWLLIYILSLGSPCWAQNPSYFILGEEKFANTDIYSLLYQDRHDLLYVGTNNGLFVYKQNQFIPLTAAEGQIGRSVFSLKEDQNGNVFCCNLTGQVFQVKGNSLELYYQAPKAYIHRNFDFFILEDGTLAMISRDILWTVSTNSETRVRLKPENLGDLLGIDVSEQEALFSLGSQQLNGDIYIPLARYPFVIRFSNDSLEALRYESEKQLQQHENFVSFGGNVCSVDFTGAPIYNPGNIEVQFREDEPMRFSQINQNEILGMDPRKGGRVFELTEGKKVVVKQVIFKNTFLSTFATNHHGTFFLGTFGGGVIVVPNRNVLKQPVDNLLLSIVTSPENEVFLSSREGKVYSAGGNLKEVGSTSFNIDNVYYLQGNYNLGFPRPPHLLFNCAETTFPPIKHVQELDSNRVLIAHSLGLAMVTKSGAPPRSSQYAKFGTNIVSRILEEERCLSVTWDGQDSLIYFSSNFRVYSRPWSSLAKDTLRYKNQEFRAAYLIFEGGNLICGTERDGVLFFRNGVFYDRVGEEDGLKSNAVDKVILKNGLLFVLTKGGLQVIDLETRKLLGLGIPEGVVYEQVTDFSLSNDMLWILEKHSYYGIALKDLGRNIPIGRLYQDSIRINRTRIKVEDGMAFSHDENALEVFFDYRNVETDQNTEIQYRLQGFDKDWRKSSHLANSIAYEYLPQGNFKFEMRGVFRDQVTNSIGFNFSIRPPFWQQWWFYVLIAAFISVATSIGFILRIRIIRRKTKAKMEKQHLLTNALDAKLKALRSQMNPHFIFNSLNSIQALILKEKTDESYDYVVMFSDLVRKILTYSEKDFIPVDEELQFLELYLTLESLRLKETFEFSIRYEGDRDLKVPSLMVQPFIENAIHHGLLHKSGQKTLDILFEFDGNLKCRVTDNGIGRAKVREIHARQNSQHVSFSLLATRQRLDLLQKQYQQAAGYEIIDLYEAGLPAGTRVLLHLPYELPY